MPLLYLTTDAPAALMLYLPAFAGVKLYHALWYAVSASDSAGVPAVIGVVLTMPFLILKVFVFLNVEEAVNPNTTSSCPDPGTKST